MKSRTYITDSNSKLMIISLGLILIVIGNCFKYELLKVNIDSLIVNLGALLLTAGLLQWIFDSNSRNELIQEISQATLGTDRIFRSGIRDFTHNSKVINDEAEWKRSNDLIIGVHYSNKFIEDNMDIIKHRMDNKKETTILHVDQNSLAAKYLSDSNSGKSDIQAKTQKLLKTLSSEFDNSKHVKLISHNRVLRYSFIKSDQYIWIKFFTNSEGYSQIPAIKVEAGTSLYEFVDNDIKRLRGA